MYPGQVSGLDLPSGDLTYSMDQESAYLDSMDGDNTLYNYMYQYED